MFGLFGTIGGCAYQFDLAFALFVQREEEGLLEACLGLVERQPCLVRSVASFALCCCEGDLKGSVGSQGERLAGEL